MKLLPVTKQMFIRTMESLIQLEMDHPWMETWVLDPYVDILRRS